MKRIKEERVESERRKEEEENDQKGDKRGIKRKERQRDRKEDKMGLRKRGERRDTLSQRCQKSSFFCFCFFNFPF